MNNVANVGIQSVPVQYNSFETMVENITGENCLQVVKYMILCSRKYFLLDKQIINGKN